MKVILDWNEESGAVYDHNGNYLYSCRDLSHCELVLLEDESITPEATQEYSCTQMQEELKTLALAGHTPTSIIVSYEVGAVEKTTEYVL